MREARPSVAVVGAGAVATALAGALRLGGVAVLGVWARRPEAARAAAARAGVPALVGASQQELRRADVVILAVSDGAIAEVAAMLARVGAVTREQVLLHCSGAISAREAFGEVVGQAGGVGTLHPLRAIPDGVTAMATLGGTVFGIEGDGRGIQLALTLVRAIGGRPLLLDGDKMAAYHAAAVMASNYAVALLEVASEVLEMAGVSGQDAVTALSDLATGSLEEVKRRGTVAGLTGPIRRGDSETVKRHLAVLAGAPTLAALYRTLGLVTVEIARRAESPPTAALDEIAVLLGGRDSGSDGPADPARGGPERPRNS